MQKKLTLLILTFFTVFAVINVQAQGNSCEGLAHANGRGNTSNVAEAHDCDVDTDDSISDITDIVDDSTASDTETDDSTVTDAVGESTQNRF
jgi:hypothetical protein